MPRDIKLLKAIMLFLERQPIGEHIFCRNIKVEGYSLPQVCAHVAMLAGEGKLDITRNDTLADGSDHLVLRITQAGYGYIEQLRSPTTSYFKSRLKNALNALVEDWLKYVIGTVLIIMLSIAISIITKG